MAVKQVFTGDSKDLEAAYKRLERENIKYRDQLQRTASASKRGSEETKRGLDLNVTTLGKMAAGWVSISKVMETVKAAYAVHRQELQELGSKQREVFGDAAKTGFSLGMAPSRVRAFAETQTPWASRQEAISALRTVGEAMPEASQERKEEVAREASKFAPVTELQSFAKLMGELGDLLPNKSGEQLAGLGIMLQDKAGADADKLISDSFLRAMKTLQGAGYDPEQTLGLGVTALQNKVPPKLLEQIATAIEEPGEPSKRRGARLTPEEAARDRLARTETPYKRLEMIFADEEVRRSVLGPKGMVQFEQIMKSDSTEQNIRDLMREGGDYSRQRLSEFRFDDPVSAELYNEAAAQRQLELAQGARGTEGLRESVDVAQADAGLESSNWMTRYLAKGMRSMAMFANDLDEAMGVEDWAMSRSSPWRSLDPRSRMQQSGPEMGGEAAPMEQRVDPQMIEQTDVLRQLNSNVRALGRRTPTPNAHNE